MTKNNLLDCITILDIRNALSCKNIDWCQFNYCNAYTTGGALELVVIGDTEYWVQPIKSYNTIVAFAYQGQFYEIGKYSRTTSKQVTQIYNRFFSNYDRFFVDRLY